MDRDTFTLAAVVTDLDRADDAVIADAVEFRMDLAIQPLSQLHEYDGDLPIIATNRARWEGGGADGPGRLEALASAAAIDTVVAVDVELESVRDGEAGDVLASAREHDTTSILSWHDFDGTPPRSRLLRALEEASEHGDIGKIAVTAADAGDVLDLLVVTYESTQAGGRVATMSMGEAGRHSRLIAPLYGSCIGYAPIDPDDATAPGQYDLETFASLSRALR